MFSFEKNSIQTPIAATGNTYDDLTDGSSTDGSISLLGDHEFIPEESDGNTSTMSHSPQPSQFWMRCQQPEIILSSRPMHHAPPHVMERRSSVGMEVNSLTNSDEMQQRATLVDQYLCNLNEKITQSYLFNVLLLILTGCSFAIFAVLYTRYITPPVNVSQLKEMIRNLELENGELSRQLSQCQIKKTTNTPTLNEQNQCEIGSNSIQGKCERSTGENLNVEQQTHSQTDGRIVWTGEGTLPQMANLLPKKQFKYEHLCDEVIHDDLFGDYMRDYCAEVRQKQKHENTAQANSKPIHYHPKMSQRRTSTIEPSTISVPDIPTNHFEFNEQFIDPNQFNTELSPLHVEPFYDDYDYGQHIESMKRKSQYENGDNDFVIDSGTNTDMVSIEEILLQMDEHLDQMTKSCYLKYKQLKDENIFNPAVMQKAQKKILKLKKKLLKSEKRDRYESGEKLRHENERKRDKKQNKENRKNPQQFHDPKSDIKWNKTAASAKEYRKTAPKSYDEHRF